LSVDGIDLSHFVDASVMKSAGMVQRAFCLSGNELWLAQKKLSCARPPKTHEKVDYIPTDSESIRGARSENRPRAKVGVSGMT
jgi:hypothetical protein